LTPLQIVGEIFRGDINKLFNLNNSLTIPDEKQNFTSFSFSGNILAEHTFAQGLMVGSYHVRYDFG
jgi:hypothetical protein